VLSDFQRDEEAAPSTTRGLGHFPGLDPSSPHRSVSWSGPHPARLRHKCKLPAARPPGRKAVAEATVRKWTVFTCGGPPTAAARRRASSPIPLWAVGHGAQRSESMLFERFENTPFRPFQDRKASFSRPSAQGGWRSAANLRGGGDVNHDPRRGLAAVSSVAAPEAELQLTVRPTPGTPSGSSVDRESASTLGRRARLQGSDKNG